MNQSFTVTTDNGTHSSNPARSNSVQPYGPTPQPTPNGGSTSGRSVTYNWNLPTNGRPITRVVVSGAASHDGGPITSISASGGYAQDLTIRVTAYSAGGQSPALVMTRRTDDPPQPQITNVRPGPRLITDQSGNGTGACAAGQQGCPEVYFDIQDFPTGVGRWRTQQESGNYFSAYRSISVTGPTTYSVPYRPIYGRGAGRIRVIIELNGQTYYSNYVTWVAPY